jgi:uncharacterized phage protein (TIGR01671 family)
MRERYKFRAWDVLRKRMVYLNKVLSSIPYYELFCHTPDSRAMELMQYTGVKDSTGKEIYEGDILIYDLIIPSVYLIVKWNEDAGGFFLYDKESLDNDTYWNDLYFGKECEVIGNKYENPELLEKINGVDERDSNDM